MNLAIDFYADWQIKMSRFWRDDISILMRKYLVQIIAVPSFDVECRMVNLFKNFSEGLKSELPYIIVILSFNLSG
tara:strand:+ start:4087 stop:4311 length:225 start_codon:yes stop_codon:yes gene_type:complete